MEDVERISHPSVPANYVSLLDLRERWMNQQQQKMQLEDIEQKEIQDDGELQVDREQVKSEKTSHPSVPANYVSILDLRERWMKQQQQKKQVEEIEQNLEEKSEPEVDQEQVNSEVEDKNDGDGKLREERHPDEKPVVQVPNPDPNTANRRLSNRKPWGGKEGHKRWVPLKQAPVATMIRPNQALSIQSSEPDRTPAPAPAELVKPKVLPPLEIPKVETVVQVPASVTKWKAKVKNRKTNRKVDLLQSQPKKGVTVANSNLTEAADEKVSEEPTSLLAVHPHLLKPPPSDTVKLDTAIQVTGEITGSGEEDKDRNGKMKKAYVRNRKRHQNHNLVPQPISDVLPPKSDLNEKYDARVQLEPKALPDLQSEQLKPSPVEANKVDLTVHPQTQSSDEVIADRKLDMIMKKKKKKSSKKNQKRYQKVESVTQPHMKKESLAQNAVDEKESIEQEVGADNNIVNDNGRTETEVVTEIKLDTVMKKKKPLKKNWKRNQKVESVTQPHLKKENLAPNVVEEKETLEQEVGADHNAEGDDWRAETEEKVAGLAVARAPEPEKSCSHRPVVAGNWKGQRQGGYENFSFKRPIMMNKDRAWGEGSLVWVKKTESSQTETGDVTVKNAGNMRV